MEVGGVGKHSGSRWKPSGTTLVNNKLSKKIFCQVADPSVSSQAQRRGKQPGGIYIFWFKLSAEDTKLRLIPPKPK